MRLESLLARAGIAWGGPTGAISVPIFQAATFRHPGLGQSTGFDYSRTANPTRSALEEAMAAADGGARACAFGSGLAAVDAVLRLLPAGGRVLVSEDLYGGTFRLIEKFHRERGVDAVYADTSDTTAVEAAMVGGGFSAIFVEVPTNPLLKVADLRALSQLAVRHRALLIVDNTFLTPALLRPFEFGADLTVYSASKYLGGHNDLVGGIAVAREADLGGRLAFVQNAAGGILGPMDSWLLLRGLKTLAVRLDRQQRNAREVAEFLAAHPLVTRVYYPGLPGDPGHERLAAQADGFGAMIAFEVDEPARVPRILAAVKVFLFAESLGGVESLITFPAAQTHADISPEVRQRLGINERLLRLSIGIENANDLIEDLAAALEA